MRKSFSIAQEAPANALALNRDCGRVVIAGRNVFKVFSIEEDRFIERLNMRLGQTLNLSFSSVDVVWNPSDDTQIATAAANGQVVIWDLNATGRNKQRQVFIEHKRTCNKVTFHPVEPHVLVSASQDGTVKLYDTRRQEVALTFQGSADSVRDVQFSGSGGLLAAVTENGQVQLWDRARPDRCLRQLAAHHGPAYVCRWHPSQSNWLATAGRDRSVKVWQVADGGRLELVRTVATVASVGCVAWRPHHPNQIASTALLVDCAVNVWDLYRPFLPFAVFAAHTAVATCVAWRHDPYTLLSTGRDGALWLHVFEGADWPAARTNPNALAVGAGRALAASFPTRVCSATAAAAVGSAGGASSSSLSSPPAVAAGLAAQSFCQGWLPVQRSDDILPVLRHHGSGSSASSGVSNGSAAAPGVVAAAAELAESSAAPSAAYFKLKESRLMLAAESCDWLDVGAHQYALQGASVAAVCEHNAAVATKLRRYHVARSWRVVGLLYADLDQSAVALASTAPVNVSASALEVDGDEQSPRNPSGGAAADDAGADTDGDETIGGALPLELEEFSLVNIASGLASVQCDFFFGDGEVNEMCLDYGEEGDCLQALDGGELLVLPNEAFEQRHELGEDTPPTTAAAGDPLSSTAAAGPPTRLPNPTAALQQLSSRLTAVPAAAVDELSAEPLVDDFLRSCADDGDVQTAVTLLMTLSGRVRVPVEAEHWFHCYLELLWRRGLWNIATRLIQRAPFGSVRALNQVGMHVRCGHCQRPLEGAGWWCRRCRRTSSRCALCHGVVRGLQVWCQGCAHGGHLHHMQSWFNSNRLCPTGCGHKCVPVSA